MFHPGSTFLRMKTVYLLASEHWCPVAHKLQVADVRISFFWEFKTKMIVQTISHQPGCTLTIIWALCKINPNPRILDHNHNPWGLDYTFTRNLGTFTENFVNAIIEAAAADLCWSLVISKLINEDKMKEQLRSLWVSQPPGQSRSSVGKQLGADRLLSEQCSPASSNNSTHI